MAYRLVTTIQRFLGTAAERAAMVTTGVNPGSTFFESDTGLMYVLDNAGVWQAKKDNLAALPAGTALIGKVGIDQVTAGANAVTLTGSSMELWGATVAARPAANTVPVGAVFGAVDTQNFWQSNGTDWVEVV